MSRSRRRRHRPQYRRITAEELVRRGSGQKRLAALLPGVAIALICAAVIALIWISTESAIRQQRADTRMRAETVAKGQANILADEAHREMQAVEQSLTILQAAWNEDPKKFDLKTWQAQMPALTDVADDIFIANDRHIIVQDILPQAVGQGVGAAYVTFGRGTLDPIGAGTGERRTAQILLGQLNNDGVVREYLVYLVRALRSPEGWLIGASYRSSALTKVFADGSLGRDGISAMIDTRHGGVQAVAGPAAVRPRLNIKETKLFKMMEERGFTGTWTGPTGIDNVERVHAFQRVPGRDLVMLTGIDRADWMAAADDWALAARSLSALASALVVCVGAAVTWSLWTLRRRRRRLKEAERATGDLAGARAEAQHARQQAAHNAAQFDALLDGTSDGVAVLDPDLTLAAWNPRFAVAAGLPRGALRRGLPVDEFLRQQARAGLFGPLPETEQEVARRLGQIRTEPDMAALAQLGPDKEELTMRARALPDGGLLLLLAGLHNEARVAAATSSDAPVEW
jgi:PAS domain-containing protein